MTLEETNKIIALFTLSGVKFDGPKKEITALWYECLKDIELKFALQATKEIIKKETELFANGLIAKLRIKAKFYKDMQQIENIKLEGKKDDIRRIGRCNK